MIITVMSDSHDNIWNLRKALEIIKGENAELIIHCGDFVAPFMFKELETAKVPVHGVFGNNDGDQYLLTQLSLTELKNITLHGPIGQFDLNEFIIKFTHYQEIADGLAALGDCKLVCYGHSHTYMKKQINDTILLNPGEIMGMEGSPGFCFVDTRNWEVERVELK